MMPAAEVEAAAAALNTFMMGDEDDGGPRRQRRHSSASVLSTGGLPPLMQAMQVTLIHHLGSGNETLITPYRLIAFPGTVTVGKASPAAELGAGFHCSGRQ